MPILMTILVVLAGLILLAILTAPVRLLAKLLINTACGYLLLFLFNLFSIWTGVILDLNLIAAVVVGFLGLPGLILLVLLHLLL